MNQNKKLSTWYFLLIMSFTVLCTLIFLVMNKIEGIATRLENRIYRRNLSYIVDKDYKVSKEKHTDQPIEFLNELSEFFYIFHENTVEYQRQLADFMNRRGHILYRFKNTGINIYDLTVVPNKEVKQYDLKEHVVLPDKDAKKFVKQIPFSRQLKFKRKDAKRIKGKMFLMCTARMSVSASQSTMLYAGFMSTQDEVNVKNLMPYKITKSKINISLNRIIYMKNPRNFRVSLKGYTNKLLRLHKVEAYCMNFNDVSNEEVQKTE